MTASALLVVGVLVLSAYALRSHGSASSPRRPAGPVLTASVRSLKLSKTLRLIPVTRLPPIKLRVRVPFTRVSLCVAVHPSSSETVVHQLSLPHLDVLSRDVGRDGVRVDAHKLAAHVDSNYSLKFVFTVHGLDEFRQLDHKLFALSTSGRCSIKVSDATLAAKLWLCPKPELAAASLRMGQLEHFALRYTRLAAPLNLFMRHLGGTIWADYPAELALTFVVREILKSDELDSDLSRLSRHLSAHVDSAQWEDKEDGDRLAAVPVLTPPTGSGRLWGLTVPSPVVLRDFKLPDLVPELYRAGGTREKLQALNFLTGKVELKLSSNAVERCSWRDAVASTQKGETRIVLEDFELLLTSRFEIALPLSPVLAATFRTSTLRLSGTSKTTVFSRTLLLSMPAPDLFSDDPVEPPSVSPFTTITPSLKLDDSKIAALLEGAVAFANKLGDALKESLARGASALIKKYFLGEKLKTSLQELVDATKSDLNVRGIEWGD